MATTVQIHYPHKLARMRRAAVLTFIRHISLLFPVSPGGWPQVNGPFSWTCGDRCQAVFEPA